MALWVNPVARRKCRCVVRTSTPSVRPRRASVTAWSTAINPSWTSRFTKVSASSKPGYCQAEPFSQKDRLLASGKVTSLRSRRRPGGSCGMNVPSLKRMANHSPSAGQSAGVARISGPRTVSAALPSCRVTTISQWHAAID